MNLLRTFLILIVAYYAFKWLVGDVYEGYCSVNNSIFSGTNSNSNSCNVCKSPKCKGCLENSTTALCGWNNSVTTDGESNWAPENLKGEQRVFKYPHYYGYGTGSGFHYGEPYYVRSVNY